MRSRLPPPVIYSIIVIVVLAGVIGGLFRSYDFNPWGVPILVFEVMLLVWSVASYRFGRMAFFAGWFAIFGAAIGFVGLISVALFWGLISLVLSGIAKGEIVISDSTPSR